MAMGQQKDRQGDLMVSWAEMPRSAVHEFCDRLQSVPIQFHRPIFVGSRPLEPD